MLRRSSVVRFLAFAGLLAGCAPIAPLDPPPPPALTVTPSRWPETVCNEQPPQAFLMRSNYLRSHEAHHRAIEYRTREYGHVEGFGTPRWNALEPKHYAVVRKFFGVPVRMNIRVLTALQCVEQAIVHACSDTPYEPRILDGLRAHNTFYDREVSNHLYGIDIDIDPGENPCCGCIAKISDRPLCKKPVSSPFERTRIPKCWVDAFERFGFYWLGYDTLEDTMHFEFLGDPDAILKSATSREEGAEARGAFVREHAARDLESMVEARIAADHEE